ncbi:MAG TPA: hypothetical protein VNM46_08075 [Xanthobacteraceae bacterium]|nr:hypothetical protein [Xanthobacteraceae bacterium]
MLKKIGVLAALTVAGAALFIPDATFARGGVGGGGGFGGFRGGALRAPAVIHRPPFMVRTGPAAFGRNGAAFRPIRSTFPPPVARQLPVHTHVGKPFAHLVQRHHGHHRRNLYGYGGYPYPFTTWDDGSYSGSYIGVPYDPGAAIPVYAPAPMDPALDTSPPPPVPRIGMRDTGPDACRAESVTVPGNGGDREITIVRC